MSHHFKGHQAILVGCTGRPTWIVMVTFPYAYMTYVVLLLAGLGEGISWRPPAYSLKKRRTKRTKRCGALLGLYV